MSLRTFAITTLFLFGCSSAQGGGNPPKGPASQPASQPAEKMGTELAKPPPKGMAVAIFAGGCFWCMEAPFDELEGVQSTTSGYTGGSEKGPTYRQVSSGTTGHVEAIRVVYDPNKITYKKLLDVFWMNIDPTDEGGQFVDRGSQYHTAIFVQDDAQRQVAEASKKELEAKKIFDDDIVVPIRKAQDFWIAEDYHQNFYKTNPIRYYGYRNGSGRPQFIEKHWGIKEKKH